LSWNISDPLKNKIKKINNKVIFLPPEELLWLRRMFGKM
jgi:hypothetical protein